MRQSNKVLKVPQIIAHRGASLFFPENTLRALREAKFAGASWVEFDVQLTQDRQVVVFHDDNLARITGLHKRVSAMSYADVASLDAGEWFHPQFAKERIPTLVQYLQLAAQLGLGINIELKGRDKLLLLAEVIRALENHWPASLPPPLLSSTYHRDLAPFFNSHAYFFGLILYRWTKQWHARANNLSAISLHVPYECLTPERVLSVKEQSFFLLAYTVNDPQIAHELLSWGVDGVFSDNPALLASAMTL